LRIKNFLLLLEKLKVIIGLPNSKDRRDRISFSDIIRIEKGIEII